MPDPVVVTRPLAQALPLAKRLKEMGREAILFPLLEIHPVADAQPLRQVLAALSRYAMVAFVSPNAIDAVHAFGPVWPRDMTFAVMGEGSRTALARHGVTGATANIVSPRDPERTDSQTLLQVLDLDALRGRQVLIVRGESGRELLGDALRDAGVQVTQIAAYRRAAPVLDAAMGILLKRLINTKNDWIVTSSEALRILIAMTQQIAEADGVAKMQQQNVIVPHARIAETARFLGFAHITLTGSGDERLLAALQFRT